MSNNLTSVFIDLASFGDANKYLYGKSAPPITQMAPVIKQSWFSIANMALSRPEATKFGGGTRFSISRAGDYLTRLQFMFVIPEVRLKNSSSLLRLRWTRNLAHHLLRRFNLADSEQVRWAMDSLALDQINAFKPRSTAYYRAIGNLPELINPTSIDPTRGTVLPSRTISLPLDFQNHHGALLPTAVLSYSQMEIYAEYRDWTELLIVDDFATGQSRPALASDLENPDLLLVADCRADYAMVSSDERAQMGRAPITMILETATTITDMVGKGLGSHNILSLNRVNGMIHTLYFGLRNITNPAEHSNYSTHSPRLNTRVRGGEIVPNGVDFFPSITSEMMKDSLRRSSRMLNRQLPKDVANLLLSYIDLEPIEAQDPLDKFGLFYEETQRLNDRAEFFSQVHPLATRGHYPSDPGYHMYTFGRGDNRPGQVDASTNFSRLTNVSVLLTARDPLPPGQLFQNFVVASEYRVCIVTGGTTGLPIMN